MPAAPERSLEQRMTALERANDVRSYRSDLKQQIKGGRRTLVEVVLAPTAELETMKVYDLLLAAPKVGRVKASRTLNQVKISPSKTVGGLSERQRRELAALLPAAQRVRLAGV